MDAAFESQVLEPELEEAEVPEAELPTADESAAVQDNSDLFGGSSKFKTMRFKTAEYEKFENGREAESLTEEEGGDYGNDADFGTVLCDYSEYQSFY